MAELMAESAHAIYIRAAVGTAFQLIENGKLINRHTIELKWSGGTVAPLITLLHIPLAGPYRLGHGAPCLCLAHAGKQHYHHVNQTVSVIVIVGKIDTVINTLTSLDDHVSQMHVIATVVVPSIKCAVIAQLNGTQNLKFGREFAARLILKVMETAVFFFIELVLECLDWISVNEFHVGIIHQDDGDAGRPQCWHLRIAVALLATGNRVSRGINRHLITVGSDKGCLLDAAMPLIMGKHITQVATGRIAVVAFLVHGYRQAVKGHQRMVEFAAMHHQRYRGSIALDMSERCRFGGYCHYCRTAHHHGYY